MVWILFFFKGDFSFGKSLKSQDTKSGLQSGWVTWVSQRYVTKLCMRHDPWAAALLWWSCQPPVAHGCILLNHLNSFCGGMFKLNEKFDAICCSTHSVILNVMATQYTGSLSGVYGPHWLVHWSHHCSHMHIPVHSPWLPGYIDVAQTIIVILTMAGLFPDRPHMFCS